MSITVRNTATAVNQTHSPVLDTYSALDVTNADNQIRLRSIDSLLENDSRRQRFFGSLTTFRSVEENTVNLRTRSRPSWFVFNEETDNRSVVTSQLFDDVPSQGCYSTHHTHLIGPTFYNLPVEQFFFSFCKEPDRLFSNLFIRKEGEKNQRGSLGIISDPVERWTW